MKLARDKEESVRMAACEHLAYKAEEVRKIVAREKDASARENQADGAPERIASNPSISEESGLELAESKSIYTLKRLLANPSQSKDVFIKLLNNPHLCEGLVNPKYDLSGEITRFFLHPNIDLESACYFSNMLRGTRYEAFDTAFVLRDDALAKGADHRTVRTFFSERARIVHELLCPLTIEEKLVHDLIY